jgi:hypothetical protein
MLWQEAMPQESALYQDCHSAHLKAENSCNLCHQKQEPVESASH